MSEEYENEVISEETEKTAEIKDETVCACPVCGKNIIERRFKEALAPLVQNSRYQWSDTPPGRVS